MTENWLPVVGHEGEYEVSDQGRVRSLPREVEQGTRWGSKRKLKVIGRVLVPYPNHRGYPQVNLRNKTLKVHLLVLAAFHGPRPDGMVARHLNDEPADNRAENLVWGTRVQNAADRVRNRPHYGGNTPKLTAADVVEVRRLRGEGWSGPRIAAHFGVGSSTVYTYLRRSSWALGEKA